MRARLIFHELFAASSHFQGYHRAQHDDVAGAFSPRVYSTCFLATESQRRGCRLVALRNARALGRQRIEMALEIVWRCSARYSTCCLRSARAHSMSRGDTCHRENELRVGSRHRRTLLSAYSAKHAKMHKTSTRGASNANPATSRLSTLRRRGVGSQGG